MILFVPNNKNNIYVGYATTTLSHRLTYHLSENSTIKQHLIIKQESIDQLIFSNVRKTLIDNIIIMYKNNNKNQLQICIKIKKQMLIK